MIDWLIETSIAVTVLMVLVLAVRRPVAHFFGAGWAYALWALPALRLVLPPLHLFGEGLPSLLPARAAVPAQAAAAAAAPPVEAAAAFNWEPLLLAAWMAGAAAMILWQAVSYTGFTRRLGIGSRVHASFAQDVGVIESPEVDGPLAIGLLDKWIVVPTDFTSRYSAREQRLALEHERVHHQREDIFWNMVALGVLALNWYNPVAYLAFRAFRTDQELSCDAAVAARASNDERHDYALALLKSASRPGLIAACPLNHAGQLKQRLRMIKSHRRSPVRAIGGSGVVAALLLSGISATESPGVAPPEPAPAVRLPAPAAPPAPAPSSKRAADADDASARAESAPAWQPVRAPARAVPAAAPRVAAAARAAAAPKPALDVVTAARASSDAAPAPAPSVKPPAPAPSPPPRVVVIETPARYAFVARLRDGRDVPLLDPQGAPTHPIPPELAARLQTALAQIRPGTHFRIIRLNTKQEN